MSALDWEPSAGPGEETASEIGDPAEAGALEVGGRLGAAIAAAANDDDLPLGIEFGETARQFVERYESGTGYARRPPLSGLPDIEEERTGTLPFGGFLRSHFRYLNESQQASQHESFFLSLIVLSRIRRSPLVSQGDPATGN